MEELRICASGPWSQIIHRSVDNDIAILLKNWPDVIRYGSNYCQIRTYFSKICL